MSSRLISAEEEALMATGVKRPREATPPEGASPPQLAGRLLHAYDERGATVEPARFLASVVELRPFFSVAPDFEPVGRHTP